MNSRAGNALTSLRPSNNVENEMAARQLGKGAAPTGLLGAKQPVVRATRSRLADIGNAVNQGLKKAEPVAKPTRLTKQKGVTNLKQVAPRRDEPASDVHMRSVRKASPTPRDVEMEDVEAVGPSAGFSSAVLPAAVKTAPAFVDDIDEDDHGDPQLVTDYVNDIYAYLRHLEAQQSIKENYLKGKSGVILPKMRAVLVDWLVDVHQQFSLLQETLYLAVAIFDRYMQVCADKIPRKKLQLVGISAMFVASKYEEMYAPELGDFVYITDNAYTEEQIKETEIDILRVLQFDLGRPLPLHFLRRDSKAGQVDATVHTLAKYAMELTLVDYAFCHIPPSRLAAAALAFAIKVLDEDSKSLRELWTPTLEHYTAYQLDQIEPALISLAKLVLAMTRATEKDSKTLAIRKKYLNKQFGRISSLPELESNVVIDLTKGQL